jgi:hypothetical protein
MEAVGLGAPVLAEENTSETATEYYPALTEEQPTLKIVHENGAGGTSYAEAVANFRASVEARLEGAEPQITYHSFAPVAE